MTNEEALAFCRKLGVVLASGKGPVPNVVDTIAGEPVRGSWWGHPRGREIFRILRSLHGSPEILVCRLIDEKLTFVHRRLWPALVRVAPQFPARRIAQVHEEHTAAGYHVAHDVKFPEWVPPEIIEQANALDEEEAFKALGPWAAEQLSARKPPSRKKTRS